MTQGVDLEILGELAPGAFRYGMTCIVEFEAHSLWHETSLTIAAEAINSGVRTEYHVFQHSPEDIRSALKEMGVDVESFERSGRFRIMDAYTPTTPLDAPPEGRVEPFLSGMTPDLERWNRAISEKIRHGFEESEKRWLHIDDNEAILLQYNDEEHVTNGWRTIFLPMAKARQLLTLHAVVTGIASDSFYRKREALADAVIDVRSSEVGGKLEHSIRLRALRGTKFDSRWRRIELFDRGLVRLSSGQRAFGFESEIAERMFDYLLKSFVDDYHKRRYPADSSGWRSLVDVAKGIGAPATSLYSSRSSVSIGELIKRGVAERKVFSKQRGRGGKVARIRLAYQRGFVREYVDKYVQG